MQEGSKALPLKCVIRQNRDWRDDELPPVRKFLRHLRSSSFSDTTYHQYKQYYKVQTIQMLVRQGVYSTLVQKPTTRQPKSTWAKTEYGVVCSSTRWPQYGLKTLTIESKYYKSFYYCCTLSVFLIGNSTLCIMHAQVKWESFL